MKHLDFDPNLPETPVTQDDMEAGLRALGLRESDSALVHTALSSFGPVAGGPETLVKALLAIIGPRGNLLMPHFFPLYEGVFDYRNPPRTYAGVTARLFREWPGAVMSVHPSHPVVVVGPQAELLTEGHHLQSAVGKDSPIERIARAGGKVLLLGVPQTVNTTLHTAEAVAEVPYWGQPRVDRPSQRETIMPDGRHIWIALPETPGDSKGFPKIEPLLKEAGLITFGQIGRARCRLMPGQGLIDTAVALLRRDPGGLLCDQPDCYFCPWARQFLPRTHSPAQPGEPAANAPTGATRQKGELHETTGIDNRRCATGSAA